ncbi:PAS domain-containing sensor histidine kinase [Flavihumibacter sp. R14]|nr:PAS domain-containing sensor histidine kinase [Flavihumibacter soli]
MNEMSVHPSDCKFLEGGGEIGSLIRSIDWTKTTLGAPVNWPAALKQTVSMMFTTAFPVLICWGKEYTQLYNDSFRPILGKNKHPQAMGLSARETFAEIWDTIGPMFTGVMDGNTIGFPNFMVPLDRNGYLEDCYFDFSYSPIKDENGEIKGILVICSEVTDKVIAIKRLKASEENIRNMVRQAPVGMCIVQGDPLFVVEVNDNFIELTGKNRVEIKSKPYWEVFSEAAEFYRPITDQVFSTGQTFHADEHEIMLIRNGKKEIVHLDFVYEPMKDENGKSYAVMIVAIDVTDKVVARKEIEKADQQFRLAVATAKLGTWDANLETGLLDLSDRARIIHGLEADQQLSFSESLEMVVPEDRKIIEEAVNEAIVNQTSFEKEYQIVPKNHSEKRWLRSTGKISFNEFGKPSTITGTIMDITERKLDELRKNDFIGMVSHELKTPLTSLSAYIQVLLGRSKDQDAFMTGALKKANKQIRKMETMINGFLNVSRLESGKVDLKRQTFDMCELLKEIEEETNTTIASHTIIFNPVISATVHADRDKIGNVITNLISNAVKYSANSKTIRVSCVALKECVQVCVKDEGIGIPQEEIDNLFYRFYRVENNSNVSGFGIGLYLSAEIVKRHNGKIWAESELGKGSTFCFTIPV